ncbi:MAG TPA: hypothetical protein VFE82_03835 [Ramlibacter sp.]|jgi:hypothetical protein|uniref:hypothetical protein n=1 Tax=Ramlibacter sp. TaxID=1917967 RepID=UPI002D36AEC7|nr:hypothetical protein [Ramlibacter sp.]HZY17584.1 hypothetical protein [Ramlibacter sp.]
MGRGFGLHRGALWLATTWLAAGGAAAQLAPAGPEPGGSGRVGSGGLGLNPARVQVPIGCGASLLPCRDPEAALAATTDARTLRWSVELGTLQLGLAPDTLPGGVRQGLNLSLVGRKPLFGSSFSVFGRLGTTYGVPDASGRAALAGPLGETGYGLSFGAGLSMSVTPRLSATFSWDNHDLRLGSGNRDSVRNTSLGLQYRY